VSERLGKGQNYGTEKPGCSMSLPKAKVKSRDAFWDNCKGLGQFFVISHHLHVFAFRLVIDPHHTTIDNKLERGYFMAIYCLTMPGYCLISGLFTPTSFSTGRILCQFKYMALFLIHHVLYLALLRAETKKPVPFFQSSGVEWFLLSLVIWRALSPLISRLKWPITLSVIFALFMMTTDVSNNVHTNVTCLFLPFFVLGLTFRGRIDELKQKRESLVMRTVFTVIVALMIMSPIVDNRPYAAVISGMACFYGNSRFEWLRYPEFEMYNNIEQMANPFMIPGSDYCQTYVGFANVLGVYVFSVFMITGFATVVPNRPVWILTKAGRNSLYIYLCHFYVAIVPCRQVAKALAASGYGQFSHIQGLLAIIGMSCLFWLFLAGDWVKYVCFPCVEPPCEKLFITEACLREEVTEDV